LSNGTTYYVWIKAKNSAGMSDFSPWASGMPVVPTAAPAAPETPTVTPGDSQLAVSWTPVAGADTYDVYYSTSDTPPSSVQQPDISGTSTTITGLSNGTTYYVWIKAKNGAGTSDFSSIASGIPVVPTAPPAAPETPTVTPGDSQLAVSWIAVAGADSYDVYYNTSATPPSSVQQPDISGTSTTITGLSNGTTYYVWIKAKNSTGTSDFSPPASAKPLGTPGTPTVTPGDSQLAVSWIAVAGADSYDVYYSESATPPSSAPQSNTSGTSTTITGINGTTYYVWIKAKNSAGTSDFSPQASAKPLGTPGTLTVTSGDGQLTVSWTAVAGADSYDVYYSVSDTLPSYAHQSDISSTSITITGINGTTYHVWIKAKNSTGTSGFSPQASGTPLVPPVNIRVVPQLAGSILISWNDAAGGVSYRVYRSDDDLNYTSAGTSSTSSYTDSGLSANTTYYYKVSTVNGSDESARSEAVSATTPIGTSIAITLSPQNDVDISAQSVTILRGEKPTFEVTGTDGTYQWYLDGNAINAATAASYILDTASMKLGVYKLTVMVSTGAGKLSGTCRVSVE
jgi:hypothetical protein